jgi:acyl-CoA reductase-like NAD-dependent aldehyde dehydrogenase
MECTPREYQLYIDGQWVDAESGETFESRCPGDGQLVGTYARGGKADVEKAVAAAKAIFDEGIYSSKDSAPERAAILRQVSHQLKERVEEFAELESWDSGKPITETSLIDVHLAADTFAFFANLATQMYSEVIPVPGTCFDFTLREAVGVVGQITAWNFPLLFTSWKMGPAVAAGCPVVYKPAEQAPSTTMEVAKLFDLVGIDAGAMNVVTGFGPEVGAPLVEHPDVAKISFTGGTATGKIIMKTAANTMKQTTLELGGKSPNIVFEDAELDKAVLGALNGAFLNQGQVCCGGSRLMVHEKVYDEFMDKFLEKAKRIQVGHPLDWETRMGPLSSKEHLEKVHSYVDIAKAEGGEVLAGGEILSDGEYAKGFYHQPTVIAAKDNSARICQEEIFGPVVSVLKFSDEDEAISIANDTIYGLAAGFWTTNLRRALRLPRKLQAGSIWVNQYNMITPYTPFGGYKQSGFGRDLSKYAIDGYTQIKNVYVDASEEILSFYE